jgi:predicted  nucleic acid-binding Zn-ribbon protein
MSEYHFTAAEVKEMKAVLETKIAKLEAYTVELEAELSAADAAIEDAIERLKRQISASDEIVSHNYKLNKNVGSMG